MLSVSRSCVKPLSSREARDVFHASDGAEHDGLTVDRSNYYWLAVWACLSTITEAGLRGGEACPWHPHGVMRRDWRKGGFTFASLIWKIHGCKVRDPQRWQLSGLEAGDGAWLVHPATKSDGFLSAQEAAPCFLAYRLGVGRCACRELARLDIAAQVSGTARACTPLFGPEPGSVFTYAELGCSTSGPHKNRTKRSLVKNELGPPVNAARLEYRHLTLHKNTTTTRGRVLAASARS